MFLNENINFDTIALETEQGEIKTYKELEDDAYFLRTIIGENKQCVILISDGSIESLSFYYCCLANKYIPYIVDQSIDAIDAINVCFSLRAAYIICTKAFANKLECFSSVFNNGKWQILQTDITNNGINSDIALLISTSGSTGYSKCVKHSYENIMHYAEEYTRLCSINEDDSTLLLLPITFAFGQCQVMSSFYKGAKIYISKFGIFESNFWSFIDNIDVTFLFCTPYMLKQLCRLGLFELPLPNLKCICLSGGFPESEMISRFHQSALSEQCRVISVYAQTEFMLISYITSEQLYNNKKISNKEVGKTMCRVEIGADHEIYAFGDEACWGYVRSFEDLSSGDENHGVIYTGDLGFLDNKGTLFITGRKAQFSKIAGIRISHNEIECLIMEHFGCDCACVGDDSSIMIFVSNFVDLEIVKQFIAQKLKISSSYIIVENIQEIPRLINGKIDYAHLNNQMKLIRKKV